MSIVDHIASIPLFRGLPSVHLEEIARIVVDHAVQRGNIIFSEGDDGNGFYVLLTGRVKIFKLSMEGKEQILHIFGPGEPFGEVPVFEGRQFPAYASAMEDSHILFFPRADFIQLIGTNPDLALNMMAVLSRRLRQFASLIEDLSLKEVPGRLAAYLVYLSEKKHGAANLELDITKSQLASLLGTIPETLSRILARLNKGGFIEVEGRKIRILDSQGLQDLAQAGTRL
jgi:CRP/FNR family transcriptional regulator